MDFIAKKVKYHHSCRKTYLNRAERIHTGTSQEKSEQTEAREIHNKAFETLTGSISRAFKMYMHSNSQKRVQSFAAVKMSPTYEAIK